MLIRSFQHHIGWNRHATVCLFDAVISDDSSMQDQTNQCIPLLQHRMPRQTAVEPHVHRVHTLDIFIGFGTCMCTDNKARTRTKLLAAWKRTMQDKTNAAACRIATSTHTQAMISHMTHLVKWNKKGYEHTTRTRTQGYRQQLRHAQLPPAIRASWVR